MNDYNINYRHWPYSGTAKVSASSEEEAKKKFWRRFERETSGCSLKLPIESRSAEAVLIQHHRHAPRSTKKT